MTGHSDDNRALMHNPPPTPETIGTRETKSPPHANETHPAFLHGRPKHAVQRHQRHQKGSLTNIRQGIRESRVRQYAQDCFLLYSSYRYLFSGRIISCLGIPGSM